MATRLVPVLFQVIDCDGNPADGWKLYFYETGTTTLKDTYSDTALTVVNANPVICNSDGRPADGAGDPVDIFGVNKEDFKVILTTDADVVVVTDDPVDTITYDINSFTTRPAQHWGTTTGTAAAFLIAPDPSITAYTGDILFSMQMSLDNNAGSTLAVFEEGTVSTYLAALDMMKYNNAGAKTALEAGDNQAGQTYLYRIDGTDAVCLNPGIPYINLLNCTQASTIVQGIAEIAIKAEILTGTDDTRVISPKGLRDANATGSGYYYLPNNRLVQFGLYTAAAHAPTITFPIAYDSLDAVIGSCTSADIILAITNYTTANFVGDQASTAGVPSVASFFWEAIGIKA